MLQICYDINRYDVKEQKREGEGGTGRRQPLGAGRSSTRITGIGSLRDPLRGFQGDLFLLGPVER